MKSKALILFGLYMAVVLMAAAVLIRTIGSNCLAAEARVNRPTEKDSLDCAALARTLTDELWVWYGDDLRKLGPGAHKRAPYPGVLETWEAARRNGEARCTTDAQSKAKLLALEDVRQKLEATSYLLSQTAGRDIALLRE